MCGINGFNWNSEILITAMNKRIRHRGPDDQGVALFPTMSLGHVRLSVLDISSRGHQPMHFQHLAIIFNGEIYNYKEVREALVSKGYSFDSDTDTEVILKSYHAWGADCLQQFNGMFAFAIWDDHDQQLFIARDRQGIKPLFYYHKNEQFIFSSEIKGILAHDNVDRTIVPERISFVYKASCLPEALTMHQYIHQLPAAHYMIVKNGSIAIKQYWSIEKYSDITNAANARTQVKALVTDAVRQQLISDVPLGVFLSGGIDSSIVAMLAAQASAQPIKTFSIGFEVNGGFDSHYNDDFYLARKTAKILGADHHELLLKKGQALAYVEQLAESLEMPNSMTVAVPSYWLSAWARQHVTVVLGGDGGDELFGGYERYQLSQWFSRWLSIPKSVRAAMPMKTIAVFAGKRDIASRLALHTPYERYQSFKFHKDTQSLSVFKPAVYQPSVVDDFFLRRFFDAPMPTADFENYFMNIDAQTWLIDHSLIRSDKVTMQFGLEQRVPFLDHRVVELSARIHSRLKVTPWQTKKILKDAFRDDLPDFLFQQPKRGWIAPAARWLRDELKDFAYDVFSDTYCSDAHEFFDMAQARKILDDHISGKHYNLQLIWTILTWQMWYRHYIRS